LPLPPHDDLREHAKPHERDRYQQQREEPVVIVFGTVTVAFHGCDPSSGHAARMLSIQGCGDRASVMGLTHAGRWEKAHATARASTTSISAGTRLSRIHCLCSI
jgi:hypothetical protein